MVNSSLQNPSICPWSIPLTSARNLEDLTESELCQLMTQDSSSTKPGCSRIEAFELLYQRIYPRVCRRVEMRLRRAGSSTSEQDNIANGVLFRVYQAIRDGKYDTDRPFEPWLIRVTDYLVIDWLRVQHPVASIDLVESAEPIATTDVSRDLEHQELSGRLQAMLDSLPEDERRVMQLHYLEELAVAEIEQQLCKTNGAVRRPIGPSEAASSRSVSEVIRI